MALLVGAFAVPKLPITSLRAPNKAGEIILLIDVSGSMAARKDLDSPNRLERAKPILYEIIDRMEELGEVRISLCGFTSIARSLVPFVGGGDYPYLRQSIKKVLDIYATPGEGSSLGRPLLNVAEKFSPDEKAKLIIVISDGEAFVMTKGIHEAERGWVEEAVKKAAEAGIKVIAVGIGEREGAKIPLYDTKGNYTGEHAILQGVHYVTCLEEDSLKEIASQTGGRYFSEENRQGLVEYIVQSLAPVPAETTEEVKEYRNIAPWFVLGALPLWVVFARRHLLG